MTKMLPQIDGLDKEGCKQNNAQDETRAPQFQHRRPP